MPSTSSAEIGLMRCNREVTGALPSGTEIWKDLGGGQEEALSIETVGGYKTDKK